MKRFWVILCAVIVLTLIAGCAQPAATPKPSPTPTPAPAPQPANVIELKFSHHTPPVSDTAKAFDQWAQRLSQETNGRVKITIYPASSLAEGKDAFPAASSGICDIAFVVNVYESSRWGLNQVINQPTISIPIDERGGKIWDQIWEKFPMMTKELEGVQTLTHWVAMPYALHLVKKTAKSPDDVKGMQICVTGNLTGLLKNAGASPVGLASNDWYMALERGVAEGLFCPYNVMTDRGIEKLTPYHLNINIGQGGSSVVINQSKWNSLPADIKAKFNELKPWFNEICWKSNAVGITNGEKKCKDLGQTIVTPTSEELKAWTALGAPMTEEWIEANKNKGPAREIFDWTKKLLADKYSN